MVFNCYIDEAGDEGIETGGSRWFILGAIITPNEKDLQTSTMVRRVKRKFGKDDKYVLQWKFVKQHRRKVYICQEYKTEQWTAICVATDKTHPIITTSSGLKQKYALYNYSARLLLERLSWYARDNGNRKALPIFEYRSNISYEGMRKYFQDLHDSEETEISWNNVEYQNFKIFPKHLKALLQATDNLCGAIKDGLEYDGFNNIEPRYILSIGERFYRYNGNIFSYGFKFLHATKSILRDLKGEYEWLKKI